VGGGLKTARVPGTLAEAQAMVAYNERILATSGSPQRLHRAHQMLANLRPHVARLEARAASPRLDAAAGAAATAGGVTSVALPYEVVWSGTDKRVSLIGNQARRV
jgi:hypothetical protein